MQQTFTEQEVKEVEDFVNFVFLNAKFDLNCKDAQTLTVLLNKMHKHVKTCRSHIMELVKVHEAPPKPEAVNDVKQ